MAKNLDPVTEKRLKMFQQASNNIKEEENFWKNKKKLERLYEKNEIKKLGLVFTRED
jgi:hypothetical protein